MYDGKWWYTYDANGNRMARARNAEHNGNVVNIDKSDEYWEYEWDYHNRLVKVQQYNAPDNSSNVCVEYTYDALNRRIERISRTNTEPEVTQYAYGRNGALTYQEKTAGSSVTTRSFVYLNNQITAFADKLQNGAEKTYYTITDIQGSVTEVYDESENLVWKSGYTAFGILACEVSNLIDFDGLYTGCDYDTETGLTYHWNRWRSEEGNSWLSEDFARDGLNWYGYAGQNPVNFIDVIGLFYYNADGQHSSSEEYEKKDITTIHSDESNNANSNLYDPYQVTGEKMGEPAPPYITIEITLGEKQKGKRAATKGILKIFFGNINDRKHGSKGKEVFSAPVVSGGIDDNNVEHSPASKGIYKNRKVTTVEKGSGSKLLRQEDHGGKDNIIIRLFGGILIHQGKNTVTQEGGFTEGCIAITAYELHEDKNGKTDVDRNYQTFSELIVTGVNIDVIIK